MERSSKRGAAEYHDQFGRFPHSLPIQFVVVEEALLVFEIPCLRKMERDGRLPVRLISIERTKLRSLAY
jgi:hypothetical protein